MEEDRRMVRRAWWGFAVGVVAGGWLLGVEHRLALPGALLAMLVVVWLLWLLRTRRE